MPRGRHLPKVTAKQQRQYEHILRSAKASGHYKGREKEVAARTVRAMQKRKANSSKGKKVLKTAGRAVKKVTRSVLSGVSKISGSAARALNPHRRLKFRNKYIDLVIKGQAKITPQGWKVGGKHFTQGRGTVKVSSGYWLDKATGFVYAKRERNIAQGFYDASGIFHPIRSSVDYDPGIAGESGSRAKRTRSKKAKASKSKASKTARHRASVKTRKASRTSLAGRSLSRTTATGKRLKRRNIEQGFYDASGVFHPIRASADYHEGQRASRSKRAKTMKKRAGSSARTRKAVASRKASTSRLAGRSLRKSSGMLKKRRNAGRSFESEQLMLERMQRELRARQKRKPDYRRVISILKRELSELRREGEGALIRSKQAEIADTERTYQRLLREIAETRKAIPKQRKRVQQAKKPGNRNPSPASIRKKFAGRVGGGKTLYFPKGTPQGLAKLGKLVSIKTEKTIIKPANKNPHGGEVWLCSDTKGKFHIGTTSKNPLFDGPARNLGKVKLLEYSESKPHLGKQYKNAVTWYHRLGEVTGVKPTLYADGKGGLRFKGGAYKITRRGIEN